MASNDREYIKINVERNYVAQVKYIQEMAQEKYDDTFNRIIFDGLLLNQIDPQVKNLLMKRQKLHKILIDFYELLNQPCQYNPQNCEIFSVIQHVYSDFVGYLLKKNLTELDKIIISKGCEFFACLENELPDDFMTFKKTVTLQNRTKPFKALFSSLSKEKPSPYTNVIDITGTYDNDDDSLHWTNDIGDMANNIMTVPQRYREEKFQGTLEIIHKKYGFDIKYEDHLRRTLNRAVDLKTLNGKR